MDSKDLDTLVKLNLASLEQDKNYKKEIERLKEKVKQLEAQLEMRKASDKESDKFWKEEIFTDDYPMNEENVLNELRDYYFILEQLPTIYMEITGNRLSKTNYFAQGVLDANTAMIDSYEDDIYELETELGKAKEEIKQLKILKQAVIDEIQIMIENKPTKYIYVVLENIQKELLND